MGPTPLRIATGEPWEVFARHDREEAARHVGTVTAATASDARVYAFMLYDERRWREMFVVRRAAIVRVITPG